MAKIIKTIHRSTKVLMGLLSIFAIIGIVTIFWKWAIPLLPKIDTSVATTPLTSWVAVLAEVVFGATVAASVESLVVGLAIFFILAFALQDLVGMFSTFNETTSWVIGFGLAIIASVTKIVEALVIWFGFTAGIGAIGIGLIIISAIVVGVLVNVGFGADAVRAIRSAKTTKEMGETASKIKGRFGALKGALEGAESLNPKED